VYRKIFGRTKITQGIIGNEFVLELGEHTLSIVLMGLEKLKTNSRF